MFLTGAAFYFNGRYGLYGQGDAGWLVAFVGFAILKDGAISYAWAARGEPGRVASALLGIICLGMSCYAAIGAASSSKQDVSDPKAQMIERYNSAERQQKKAEERLAEIGKVPNPAEAKAIADRELAKVDASISKRTASCTNLEPKGSGARQIAVNREACQPYRDAVATIDKAQEAEKLRMKLDSAEAILSEGKPASADAQASTIAAFLSLFTVLQGISGIQAWTALFVGLSLEIASPLAWATFASAMRKNVRPVVKSFDSVDRSARQADIPAVSVDDSEQSDLVALDGPERFAEAKAALLGPNGPTAEIVTFPGPNGSPNGSPNGPKPGNRERTAAKEAALTDLQGRLERGERFGSQVELAHRYDVATSTMSEWLGEWERSGLIPTRTTVGRCKEVAAG